MKIRHCPGCAQLVHFPADHPLQRCWNCGQVSDFSRIQTLEQRFGSWLLGGLDAVLQSLPAWPPISIVGRVALVASLPVAVLMLLVCNSFDVRIVHDLTASFTWF